MNYQLVMQFPLTNASADDFDRLLMIENELELVLRGSHQVTGHDIGPSELNIFIHTNDPNEAFEQAKNALTKKELATILVAFKDIKDEKYSVLWPEHYRDEFTIK